MGDPPRFQLVLQFPGESLRDFDHLIAMEDALVARLGATADVDGHDFGSGEGNIFILTQDPETAFRVSLDALDEADRKGLRAAYRRLDGGTYKVLWPQGLQEFRIV